LGKGGIEGAVSSKEEGAHKAKNSRRHIPLGKRGEKEKAGKQKKSNMIENSNMSGDSNAL
jgi:hypothetical protein